MGSDDTRYTIVSKRMKPPASPVASPSSPALNNGASPRTKTITNLPPAVGPEPPPLVAQGSKTIPLYGLREQIAAREASSVTRVFGNTELLLQLDGEDRVAMVLPGALRMIGTREEALALAAALVRLATK